MPRDFVKTDDLSQLNDRFRGDPLGALEYTVGGGLGPVALVSSFGAESAVLLHMVARIDRGLPVLLVDTLLLFPETLRYQQDLTELLSLTAVQRIQPDRDEQFLADPENDLHRGDPDACCALRKARPLARALGPYDAWITGRKRFQNGTRARLEMFEPDPQSHRIKINPLVDFSAADLRDYAQRHDLPPHPLVTKSFTSIGCAPCTTAVLPGEDPRAGRWRGGAKTECGIHISNGKLVRGAAA